MRCPPFLTACCNAGPEMACSSPPPRAPLHHAAPHRRAVNVCQDALARGDDEDGSEGFTFSVRTSDLASMRGMASDITECGARLYELLKREGGVREARETALRFLDAVSGSL